MPDPVDLDRLFQVDLDQFVAERNALAKALKSQGQRDEAARVAKLRRPPATAWALNQVARSDPALVDSVLRAGADLRAAMEQTLGGDASGLRAARSAESQAVQQLTDAGAGRLRQTGQAATEAARQRMTATLRAAIVDDSVAEQLRAGTLDIDREAPGFGLDAISFPAAAAPQPPAGDNQEAAERLRRQQARQSELVAEADRLGRRAERLADEATQAERRAAEARAEAGKAAADAAAALRMAQEMPAE